jgi:hypothetical protein
VVLDKLCNVEDNAYPVLEDKFELFAFPHGHCLSRKQYPHRRRWDELCRGIVVRVWCRSARGERGGDRREPPHVPLGARYVFEGEKQAVFAVGVVFSMKFSIWKMKKQVLADFFGESYI